jgi:hypothetical protein
LELIPTDILNYPIIVPDDQYVPPPPTTVPTGNQTGGQTTIAVNCKPFKATSPLDGLNYGMNTFYWDAAPGATTYRVNVDGAGSKEVDAPTTNASFDISSAGFNPQLSWSVDALVNGVVVCSTATITIPRQWAPPPPATPVPGFGASWTCGNGEFTIYYSNVPAGSTSITINFDSNGAEPSPNPPIIISSPPSSGNVVVQTFSSGWDLFAGSVTASPSGAAVALPDISCGGQAA